MTKFYKFNGKNYELPDEATQDQIQEFILGYSNNEGNPEIKNTLLGNLPTNKKYIIQQMQNPDVIKEIIRSAMTIPSSGIVGNVAEKAIPLIAKEGMGKIKKDYEDVKGLGQKGIDYIRGIPLQKEAEEFRNSLNPGETSSENIENLGKRVQFAKKSGETEALEPKKELYSQEGKSNIYEIGKENLPEGNLPKMAHMIEPGAEFGEQQQSALKKALKNYRKTGDVESFMENSEDIFGIEQLSPKAESQIEDSLLLPINRESKYFSESNNELIKKYYTDELKELHAEYKENPTLNNYDKLQSELKSEKRNLFKEGKSGDRSARRESRILGKIIDNLQSDQEAFVQTLPEKMHNLSKEFSEKWATGPAKFSNAKLTIQRLSDPDRVSEVSDADILRTFTKPNKNTKDILSQLGPSAGSNILYSALNKVRPGDYDAMADTILELKRTKGFDKFIKPNMEAWANSIKAKSKKLGYVQKGLTSVGGGLLGGALLGEYGAGIGMLTPFASKPVKAILEKYKR